MSWDPVNEQVLKELSAIPRRCDLAANLRFAAASIVKRRNETLHLWLQGGPKPKAGLITIVLGIMQDLLTGNIDTATACDVCAAAAAVLANVIHVAGFMDAHASGSGQVSKRLVTDQVVNMTVLQAIVETGMLHPSAAMPLPPGHSIHIELPTSRVHRSQQSWTPLRICGHLLAEMTVLLAGGDGAEGTTDGFKLVVGRLAEVRVFQSLLEAVLEDPTSEMPWLVIAAIAQCHQEASSSCLHQLEPLMQRVVDQMQERQEELSLPAASARYECWWLFAVVLRSVQMTVGWDDHAPASKEEAAPMAEIEELMLVATKAVGLPAVTNEVLSVATKEVPPVATNEVPPVATKEVPPVATKEVPPVATKEVPPVATKEVPPVATKRVLLVVKKKAVPRVATEPEDPATPLVSREALQVALERKAQECSCAKAQVQQLLDESAHSSKRLANTVVLLASKTKDLLSLRDAQKKAEKLASRSREKEQRAAEARQVLHQAELDRKNKELAEKAAALRGLRQALVSATDQAKHWRQQAGVWKARAERSAERVEELKEHVQSSAKLRKVLAKQMEEMKESAREQRCSHQADVRTPVPDQEEGRAVRLQAGVLGRGGGPAAALGMPQVTTAGEARRVDSLETEEQDGCPFSYWTDAAGGPVTSSGSPEVATRGEAERELSPEIEAQSDGCPFSYWTDGAVLEQERCTDGAQTRSEALGGPGTGGGRGAGAPSGIKKSSLEDDLLLCMPEGTASSLLQAPPSQQGTLLHLRSSLSDQQRLSPELSRINHHAPPRQNEMPSIPAWLLWLPNLLMLLVATVAILVSWASSLLVIQGAQ